MIGYVMVGTNDLDKAIIFYDDVLRELNLKRVETKKLINQLAKDNPKIPSNILHALQSLQPSQLMDQNRWEFKHLEENLLTD